MPANKRETLLATYTLTPAEMQHARLVLSRLHPEADETVVVPLAVSVAKAETAKAPVAQPQDCPAREQIEASIASPSPGGSQATQATPSEIKPRAKHKRDTASSDGPWAQWGPEDHISDEALIKAYDSIVKSICGSARRVYSLSAEDLKDLRQVLNLKLTTIPAEKRHRHYFVRKCLKNRYCDYIRWYKRQTKDTYYLSDDEEDGAMREYSTALATSHPSEDTDRKEQVAGLLDALPELQQRIIRAYFGFDEKAITAIPKLAKSLRITEVECAAELQAALATMREASAS